MSTHTTEGGLFLVRMEQPSCLLILSHRKLRLQFAVVHLRMTVLIEELPLRGSEA